MGTPEEFARLRDLLERAGYTESLICERAEVPSIHFFPAPDGRTALKDIRDAQSLLVRLFLDGDHVPWAMVRFFLRGADLGALEALDLLHSPVGAPELCAAKVGLYPIDELYIAADRPRAFDTSTSAAAPDLVFSPVSPETYRFLHLMPRVPCESLLELCSGTAVAGMLGARRFARRVTAIDITERSSRFARFNASLNGIDGVRVLQGDLYAPIAGESYDLILAHPPYVPSLESRYVFRDGGEDGEEVTRRILAGLADHLRPGGQFFCDCMITDRDGAPLESRVRAALGRDEGEFDVLIAQSSSLDPLHYVTDQARDGRLEFESLVRWNETFRRLEVDQLVFTSILVQRRAERRPVVTSRRVVSPLTSAADLQWVLRWMVQTASWDADQMRQLLGSRPRTLPRTELRSRSIVRDRQWTVEECTLVTLAPFAVEASCPAWYATLLQWCDGRMTAREHLQFLRETKVVPESAPEDLFVTMIRQLVDAGLIEIDEFRLPDATAMRDAAGVRERTTDGPTVERAD
jgi:SAM-dependent methyltransferase